MASKGAVSCGYMTGGSVPYRPPHWTGQPCLHALIQFPSSDHRDHFFLRLFAEDGAPLDRPLALAMQDHRDLKEGNPTHVPALKLLAVGERGC